VKLGQKYLVEWDDCCVSGRFTAILVDMVRDEDGGLEYARFSNGVELTNLFGVRTTPQEDPPSPEDPPEGPIVDYGPPGAPNRVGMQSGI